MRKKILLALISIGIVFSGLAAAPANVSGQTKKEIREAKKLTDEGDQAFRRKDFDGAIVKYTQATGITPKNAYAHFWKGYSHYNLKQYDPAIGAFDAAAALGYKPLGPLYTYRGISYHELGKYDEAMADIQNALAITPNDPFLNEAMGNIYIVKGMHKEALAAYQKAIPGSQNKGDVQYNIARVQQSLLNYKEQAAAADAAVKLGTKHVGEAYFLLGEAEHKLGNLGDASEAYERSIAAKPDNYATYRNAAETYRGQGRFEDAIKVLKKSFVPFGAKGETFSELSWYYSMSGQDEAAVEAGLSGVRLSPGSAGSHTNLCRAYNGAKQYQLAINSCNAALKINANDGETYFYLARAQDSLGRTAEAGRTYKRAVTGLTEQTAKNPDYADGYYLLGNALFADNQTEKAIEATRRAIELSPRFAKARYNLAVYYLSQKKKDMANDQYNELMKFDKDQAAKLKALIDQ